MGLGTVKCQDCGAMHYTCQRLRSEGQGWSAAWEFTQARSPLSASGLTAPPDYMVRSRAVQ